MQFQALPLQWQLVIFVATAVELAIAAAVADAEASGENGELFIERFEAQLARVF